MSVAKSRVGVLYGSAVQHVLQLLLTREIEVKIAVAIAHNISLRISKDLSLMTHELLENDKPRSNIFKVFTMRGESNGVLEQGLEGVLIGGCVNGKQKLLERSAKGYIHNDALPDPIGHIITKYFSGDLPVPDVPIPFN